MATTVNSSQPLRTKLSLTTFSSHMRLRWMLALLICLTGLFAGCGGIGLAYQKRLVGNLGLTATDVMEQMAVVEFNESGRVTGLISQTVFSIGSDPSHIIAKRHPSEGVKGVDKSVTEFFILTVHDRKAHGPFDAARFVVERRALGVADSLDFTLTFKELE